MLSEPELVAFLMVVLAVVFAVGWSGTSKRCRELRMFLVQTKQSDRYEDWKHEREKGQDE